MKQKAGVERALSIVELNEKPSVGHLNTSDIGVQTQTRQRDRFVSHIERLTLIKPTEMPAPQREPPKRAEISQNEPGPPPRPDSPSTCPPQPSLPPSQRCH